LFLIALGFAASPAEAWAQRRNRNRDENFVASKPAVGDLLPDVEVCTPDGKPFNTAELRGRYAVLVFGCLT
jgi:cytochrome oxidase Cu insertion factor (SCO1/SenC/PrrC family)